MKLGSNRAAAEKLRSDLVASDQPAEVAAEPAVGGAEPASATGTPIERQLKISLDLLKINAEERELTTELQGLLEAKAKVELNERQSE